MELQKKNKLRIKKDESLMPLSFGERSRCYNTLVIKFKEKIDEEYQIEVKLNQIKIKATFLKNI